MPENGKSRSSVENFSLTLRGKFLETTSKFQNFWDLGNFHAYHGFPSIFFRLTAPKNFERNHLTFQKVSNVRYRKKNWIRTEHHDFQSKIFCLRVPKSFVGEHFGISEKFGYRKISCLRGWYHFLSVEFFSRILPIKLGRESLFVSESLGHRRLLCSVAGYCDSPLISLASQSRKISCVTPSNFRKDSGIEYFYAWERKITFFIRIFLSHSTQKLPGNDF